MKPWALVFVGLLVFSGCLGGATNASDDANLSATHENDTSPGEGPSPGAQASTSGSVDNRSLYQAPTWQVGEWWEIRLESPLLSEESITWTRVVAGHEGSDYLVGQPRDSWSPEGILFHFPGLGEVAKQDLSFEAHDARFHPVQWPLVSGTEWETQFEGLDVSAQVMDTENNQTAEIWYCCGRNVTATYDADLGVLSKMNASGLLTYEVVDHGFDYNGVVTVPHGHDLVFNHGRIASVVTTTGTQPAPPTETVDLSDDYGRVTFAGIVGDVLTAPPAGGAYLERVTGPDGTEYTTQRLPHEGAGLTVNVFETTDLGGTWQLDHAAAGPGIAFTEGIAYHIFDMRLPEGELLGNHSQHQT